MPYSAPGTQLRYHATIHTWLESSCGLVADIRGSLSQIWQIDVIEQDCSNFPGPGADDFRLTVLDNVGHDDSEDVRRNIDHEIVNAGAGLLSSEIESLRTADEIRSSGNLPAKKGGGTGQDPCSGFFAKFPLLGNPDCGASELTFGTKIILGGVFIVSLIVTLTFLIPAAPGVVAGGLRRAAG